MHDAVACFGNGMVKDMSISKTTSGFTTRVNMDFWRKCLFEPKTMKYSEQNSVVNNCELFKACLPWIWSRMQTADGFRDAYYNYLSPPTR